jgi:hypothetical protein
MPATYPEITFDDHGLCHHCLTYEQPQPLGQDRLLQKIRAGRGAQYDCVLGISGGKDSCYVAYLAARKLGLRVLAVSYDFPFMVDLARENTRSVCEQLGIELLVVRSRNNLEVDLLRNHLISLAATGTTWGQCMFCHYGIAAILYHTAQSRQIPFILSGVTHSETWWNPGNRMRILARRLRDLPLTEKAIFGLYQARAFACLVDQRRQFPMPGNSALNVYRLANTPAGGPQTIRVFDYVGWDQELIEKTLQEETGWRKPPTSLTWRYDCMLEPLLDLTFKRDLGISSAGLYLCGLIRSGQMGREEALRLMQEKEDPSRLEASLKSVLNFLAIPPAIQAKYFGALGGEPV